MYEGDHAKASDNVLLDNFTVVGPREQYAPKHMEVLVTMYVDMDGILHVNADPTGDFEKDMEQLGAVNGATGGVKLTISRNDPSGLSVDADQLHARLLQHQAIVSEAVAKAELKTQIKEERDKLQDMGQPLPCFDESASKAMLQVQLKEVQKKVAQAAAAAAAASSAAEGVKRAAEQAADGSVEQSNKKPAVEQA